MSNILIQTEHSTSRLIYCDMPTRTRLEKLCSYYVIPPDKQHYVRATRDKQWDGKKSLLNTYTGEFPTGLVPRVRRWLKDHGYVHELRCNTPSTSPHPKLLGLAAHVELRDYQTEAVCRMLRFKRGVIQVPTRGGKTEIAGAAIAELKRTAIFFVPSLALLEQTIERFSRLFPGQKIGRIGDGVIEPSFITVASVQTIAGWLNPPRRNKGEGAGRYQQRLEDWAVISERGKAFLAKFAVALFDECHHLAADTFYQLAMAMKGAEYVFALSATPFRDDEGDLLIEAGSGPLLYSIDIHYLVSRGYLVPADVHIHEYPDPPYLDIGNKYDELYKYHIVHNAERNNKIIEVAQADVSAGRQVLILVRELDHLANLKELAKTQKLSFHAVHGQTEGRESLISAFRGRKYPLLIATSIFDEGMDMPALDSVILAGAGRSRTKSYQRFGRALTPYPGKSKAIIHDFRDYQKPFNRQFKAREGIYKAEPDITIYEHSLEREKRERSKYHELQITEIMWEL